MTEAKRTANAAPLLDEANVAAYLHNHPDFLRHHPEVLAELEVRHDSGAAASLIERQVALLRDNNRELQARLDEFTEAARGNERRVAEFGSLARALVSAGNVAELVTGLTDCVQREMNVDAVFVGIRAQETEAGQACGRIHILTDDDPCDDAVTHVFRRGKPVCGPLSRTQAKTLFGGQQPAPESAAMVPLGIHGVHGALVLASTDAEHFVPDMGTLFLELIGELVTTALRRHLGSESLP